MYEATAMEATESLAVLDSVHRYPAPPMPEAAPVDRAHLVRYTLGDPVLEREVLGLFLGQIPLTIESLKFAATDKDWHMAAHTLKGSARAVGAWRLARLASEAEKLGRAAAGTEACEAISAIEAAAAEVAAYLAIEVPGIGP